MLDRISFLVGEALVAMRRNYSMTFASITTVAVSLFLIGAFGVVSYLGGEYLKTIPGKFEMRVHLREGTAMPAISATAQQIRSLPGVATVAWIPRDKAWELQRKKYRPELVEGLENPLPDAYKVVLSDLKQADAVAQAIQRLPAVEPSGGVKYMAEAHVLVERWTRFSQGIGTALAVAFFITGGVLIYNTIRLTVIARRLEVRIMRLVGASPFTVHAPFMIEGVVHGTIGGLIASLLLIPCVSAFTFQLAKLGVPVAALPIPLLLQVLCLFGAMYGLACSLLAVRVPLRFR